MRIVIITLGTRGDVQPYIALGQGLIKAGHTVRLATYRDFEVLVKAHGLEFGPIRGNSQELMESQAMRDVMDKGNFIATTRYMIKTAERAVSEWMEDGVAACQDADLIIAGSVGLTIGTSLAEKFHLPCFKTTYFRSYQPGLFPVCCSHRLCQIWEAHSTSFLLI